MDLTLTTPALLFPTVSLLLLAYTNRFLAVAALIRGLKNRYIEDPSPRVLAQIANLALRIRLMRSMQWLGTLSLFLAVACMAALFSGQLPVAEVVFGLSLLALLASLGLSIREIHISVRALELELEGVTELAARQVPAAPSQVPSGRPIAVQFPWPPWPFLSRGFCWSRPLVARVQRSVLGSAFLDGVNVASLALMVVVALQFARAALVDPLTLGIALIAALFLLHLRVSSTWGLGGAALLGALAPRGG